MAWLRAQAGAGVTVLIGDPGAAPIAHRPWRRSPPGPCRRWPTEDTPTRRRQSAARPAARDRRPGGCTRRRGRRSPWWRKSAPGQLVEPGVKRAVAGRWCRRSRRPLDRRRAVAGAVRRAMADSASGARRSTKGAAPAAIKAAGDRRRHADARAKAAAEVGVVIGHADRLVKHARQLCVIEPGDPQAATRVPRRREQTALRMARRRGRHGRWHHVKRPAGARAHRHRRGVAEFGATAPAPRLSHAHRRAMAEVAANGHGRARAGGEQIVVRRRWIRERGARARRSEARRSDKPPWTKVTMAANKATATAAEGRQGDRHGRRRSPPRRAGESAGEDRRQRRPAPRRARPQVGGAGRPVGDDRHRRDGRQQAVIELRPRRCFPAVGHHGTPGPGSPAAPIGRPSAETCCRRGRRQARRQRRRRRWWSPAEPGKPVRRAGRAGR